MADESAAQRFHVTLGDATEVSCSLDAEAVPFRVSEWRELLKHVDRRTEFDGGLRMEFGAGVPTDELMRLVTAEQSCCSFFRFAILVDPAGVALEVRSEPAALDAVTALFG